MRCRGLGKVSALWNLVELMRMGYGNGGWLYETGRQEGGGVDELSLTVMVGYLRTAPQSSPTFLLTIVL